MTTTTPALDLAAHLANLAEHLTAHPHLHPVNIDGRNCQVRYTSDPAGALVAWADSMAIVHDIVVRGIEGHGYVYVQGMVGSRLEEVWTVVPGLLEHVGMGPDDDFRPFYLDGLRKFAALTPKAVSR